MASSHDATSPWDLLQGLVAGTNPIVCADLKSCSIGINRFRLVVLVELFHVLLAKKPFFVGLVAQLFQPASNWVETVDKALLATAVVFTGASSCYLRD